MTRERNRTRPGVLRERAWAAREWVEAVRERGAELPVAGTVPGWREGR